MESGRRPDASGILTLPVVDLLRRMSLAVPRPRHRVALLGLSVCVVFAAACEAGPSTFDGPRDGSSASEGAPDSADESTRSELSSRASGDAAELADAEGNSSTPREENQRADAEDDSGSPREATDGADAGGESEVAEGTTDVVDAGGDPAFAEGAHDIADASAGFATPVEGTAVVDMVASDGLRFPHPDHVRGLYVNAWAAGSRNRLSGLLKLAASTEINTFVIDIKDASGYISHRTELAAARDVGATEEIRIRDLPGLLEQLEKAGIYPIARIVVVKDPLLSSARPELAVQDTAGGVWVDGKGIVWLNPYNTDVWKYHVELAREVAQLGFPEIQWDYVRFPDSPLSDRERATYPGAADQSKPDAIRAFLDYSRDGLADLGVKVTADVFGVTTSASRDVGIGQVWESFIDVVDVALPMVYPSHYFTGSFGFNTPNAHPYEIVRRALRDAVRRSAQVDGAGMTRPWLQDFSLGEPKYGAPEVRAQIQGTYDAGVQEWILWNPGSYYTPEALEPVGGFLTEPLMRVADEIAPISRRYELADSTGVR